MLELDHAVDIGEACRLIGPDLGLWANLDPVGVLSQGTPESVRAEVLKVLSAAQRVGHRRFVLSSGCTLAMETPEENLHALINAAKEFSAPGPDDSTQEPPS